MLSRGNTEAAIHLRRSKSSPSVVKSKSNIETAPTAEQKLLHARIAATLAYGVPRYTMNTGTTPARHKCQSEGTHLSRQRSGFAAKSRPGFTKDNKFATVGNTQKTTMMPRRSMDMKSTQASETGMTAQHTRSPKGRLEVPSFASLFKNHRSSTSSLRYSNVASSKYQSPTSENTNHIASFVSSVDSTPSKSKGELYWDKSSGQHLNDPELQEVIRSDNFHGTIRRKSMLSFGEKARPSLQSYAQQDAMLFGPQSQVSEPMTRAEDNSGITSRLPKLSAPLKNLYRRAFGRTVEVHVPTQHELPLQQVQARKSHFSSADSATGSSKSKRCVSDSSSGHGFRFESRPPTPPRHVFWPMIDTWPQSTDDNPCTASGSSSNKSTRITSWTNTSLRNSLTRRDSGKLSTIKEPGLDTTSFSQSCSRKPSTALRQSVRRLKSKMSFGTVKRGSYNHDVYSALLDKLGPEDIDCDEDNPNLIASIAGSCLTAMKPNVNVQDHASKSTVRVINSNQDEFYEKSSAATPAQFERNMVSPSVYSLRLEYLDHRQRDASKESAIPNGTALVEMSHPISKWNLDEASPSPTEHKPNTSNDWRAWTATQLANFDQSTRVLQLNVDEQEDELNSRQKFAPCVAARRIGPNTSQSTGMVSKQPSRHDSGNFTGTKANLIVARAVGKTESAPSGQMDYPENAEIGFEVRKVAKPVTLAKGPKGKESLIKRPAKHEYLTSGHAQEPDLSIAVSPMDDKFIRRLQRGPYASPCLSSSSFFHSKLDSHVSLSSSVPGGAENTPPSSIPRIRGKLLEKTVSLGRAQEVQSSPVFL